MNTNNTEPLLFDKKFSRYYDAENPGLAVLVVQHGKTRFRKGYGLSNLCLKEKAGINTNFRLASVSKQFTAMCIAILEEKCELTIDDPIAKYFSDLPGYMKDIYAQAA